MRVLAYLLAALSFLGAAMLDAAPAVPRAAPPGASDVRAARMLARRTIPLLRGQTRGMLSARQADLDAAARLLSNWDPRLRADAKAVRGTAEGRASLRLAGRTWLNASFRMRRDARGGTVVDARLGALPLPAWLVRPLADFAVRRVSNGRRRSLDDMLSRFSSEGGVVRAALDMPPGMMRGLRGELGDEAATRRAEIAMRVWRRLGAQMSPPEHAYELAQAYRSVFTGQVRLADEAAAAATGVAMLAVSPFILRVLEPSAAVDVPRGGSAVPLMLAGRGDLAKHYALSAAIAGATRPGLSRALGEWKELDDSLPGGSGFSFVDLAADRAGTRLGAMLADPALTAATQRRLAAAGPDDLLPLAALGFGEGLSAADFERRYGDTQSAEYRAALRRIDAALDRMPLYRR